jgi:tripartite-type tricarboxylate transporter receptor subunit TctC
MLPIVKLMKAKPGEVKFFTCWELGPSHLCAMLMTQTTATGRDDMPYWGTGPALQDLIAGNVDLICVHGCHRTI